MYEIGNDWKQCFSKKCEPDKATLDRVVFKKNRFGGDWKLEYTAFGDQWPCERCSEVTLG